MLVWAALPILVFAVLASGPFRDSMPSSPSPNWLPFSVSSSWSVPWKPEDATRTVADKGVIEHLTAGRLASAEHGGTRTLVLTSRCFLNRN
jgi:hypothetical protein